jgi:hypothetical protein
MKTKKAQGLSLNMIVIGAIALVVLVVVITIFISGMRESRPKEEQTCAEANGFLSAANVPNGVHFIISPTQCANIGGSPILGKFSDVAPPMVCCNKGACDNVKKTFFDFEGKKFATIAEAKSYVETEFALQPDEIAGKRSSISEKFDCFKGHYDSDPKYQADCCI